MADDRIDEGVRRRAAQAGQVTVQPLQRFEAVAKHRRPLERLPRRRLGHVAAQGVQRRRVVPGQKGQRRPHLAAIVVSAARPGARAQTVADLVPQTRGGPQHREQFLLVGPDQFLGLRTVAQLEPVVEPAHRVARLGAPRHWTEGRRCCRRRSCRQEGIRRWPTADAHVAAPPAARLTLHVEARLPAPDQFQFAQQGGELVGHHLPHQRPRRLQDAARLGIAAVPPKIAQQPRPQALGLADVDQFAAPVHHAVHAGQARTPGPHLHPQTSRPLPVYHRHGPGDAA